MHGEREVPQERQGRLQAPELRRAHAVDHAAEGEAFQLAAVGEDVREDLAVSGDGSNEVDVGEVADGEAVRGECPGVVDDVHGPQEVAVLREKRLGLVARSAVGGI